MEEKQTPSERSIVDMLRDDQSSGSKKNWKAFRDKLRLKRTGKAWTSSVPIPASDVPIQGKNRMMTRRGSWRFDGDSDLERSGRLLPVETDPENEEGTDPVDGEKKPGGDQQMSLMNLLSSDGSNYQEDEEELVEECHDEAREEEDDGDCNVCGGCKGKHKGAALGPCGHTFCKQCTKELQVGKGNCPTCNDFILEILDIF